MKFLLALCFVAAVAQATEIDWSNVQPIDAFPEDLANAFQENGINPGSLGSRIVGGQEATPGQFPFQIGLLSTSSAGTGFCGGSILNEEWILTAAHCVDTARSAIVVVAAHRVNQAEAGQLRISAAEIIVHANWDSRNIKNDIALIRLSSRLTFNNRIQPIRLPRRAQASTTFAGVTGTVSGWGRDSDSATGTSPVLRWTSNPIITNSVCNARFFGLIDNQQICLSGDGGRSSCNGDSGGPLTVVDSDGRLTQVGVVSFGISLGCAVGWPGVYVRLTSYLDWIQTNTRGAIVTN